MSARRVPRRPLGPAALALAAALLAAPASAHEGPPFPVIVDEVHGPWLLSVWADPDIGTGTYYVLLDPAPGASLPAEATVTLRTRPLDTPPDGGSLPWTSAVGERARRSEGQQYDVEVHYPEGGFWTVRIGLEGGGQQAERSFDIEVTPPGLGPIDLLWYLAPFLVVAFLWGKALLVRYGGTRSAPARPPAPQGAARTRHDGGASRTAGSTAQPGAGR